ncbi:hypothetical protein Pmani_002422 [Petrolisthes manimaculis]|uniref:Uncharacterized protein n=1 Tax=Petrolisthes manimaculis TaxID=1843537 RepID=A0AAE1UNI0_9EUCA|nr:hypothetical protein Pmani_002422 [Petrolisthes manimaculis]
MPALPRNSSENPCLILKAVGEGSNRDVGKDKEEGGRAGGAWDGDEVGFGTRLRTHKRTLKLGETTGCRHEVVR